MSCTTPLHTFLLMSFHVGFLGEGLFAQATLVRLPVPVVMFNPVPNGGPSGRVLASWTVPTLVLVLADVTARNPVSLRPVPLLIPYVR